MLEPLLTPQIKDYRLSWLCGRSWSEKSFACTNEGVFIAQGETDPCGYSTTHMTIWLPWLFDLHDSLFNKWVSWTSMLHHIGYNKPIMEMWVTWIMTWLNMTWHENVDTFALLLECMLSYSATGWWMSSWCIIASPPHGEVLRVFDGPWLAWWSFSMLFLACMLEGLTGSSVREGTCSSYSSTSHALFIPPLVNLYFYMCFLHSSHSSSCHVCWCTCTCSHSWRDDIKSKTS